MKKKEKIIEDKTFGIKNKKGSKQQKFIQTVQQQVTMGGKTAKQLEKEKADKIAKKEDKKKEAEELNVLFKPVEQKVPKGTDPKSVLCAFFKAGQCTKGDKCKFSHDLNIGRKGEKRSMYDDGKEPNENDTMENWDEAMLEEVVAKKHAESDKLKPKTDIICKYFIDALESSKYGWFWQCPNGEQCIYKHALPPGFVLKKDQKKLNPEDMISLEDLIERERAALNSQNLTKVTLDSFLKWKERKRKEKLDKVSEEAEKKKANYSAGKMFGISGREMFEFNPELMTGDDLDGEDIVYQREVDSDEDGEDGGPVREVNLDMFSEEAQDYEELAASSQLTRRPPPPPRTVASHGATNGRQDHDDDDEDDSDDEDGKLDEAAAYPLSKASSAANYFDPASVDDIDENLFDEDGLDEVEEELDTLELSH